MNGVTLIDTSGRDVGQVELPPAFRHPPKSALLHQAVVRHLANRRAGTAKTKKRDEVSGGGRKPWRQKGTGRARHGSIRSPLWRKGGIVFGPQPRSYRQDMPRRARRIALAMAVAAKAASGELRVINGTELVSSKTKDVARLVAAAGGRTTLLVVHATRDPHAAALRLAGRNLARGRVMTHHEVSVHALLRHERIILTSEALAGLAQVCHA